MVAVGLETRQVLLADQVVAQVHQVVVVQAGQARLARVMQAVAVALAVAAQGAVVVVGVVQMQWAE